jgi:hypothetical protein
MFDVINTTLSAAVVQNGTFTVAYPAGRSAGNYTGGHRHKLIALQTVYSAPGDFTVSFDASVITITYKGATTLPAGTSVRFQADRLGADDNVPEGVTVNKQTQRASAVVLDLGSPATADTDGVAASQSVSAGAAFTLNGALVSNGVAVFDTPRNVVGSWTGTSVLTITGTDVDGNTVVEQSASGTSHTGKKAFKTVTRVASSASITSATVGTGVVLGLPIFVPDASLVLAELKNGAVLPRKSGRVLLPYEVEATELAAGTKEKVVSPVAGTISRARAVVQEAIVTGGDITFEVGSTAVDGLTLTVANSATAGTAYTGTPTAGHASTAVTVGDVIGVIPASAFNGGGAVNGFIELDLTAAQQLDGTFVAGVTAVATATTGDVRGTYTPSATPDGTLGYQLVVWATDPANRGVAQYAG